MINVSFGPNIFLGLLLGFGILLLYFLRFVIGWVCCTYTFVAPLIIKENIPMRFKEFLGLCFYIFIDVYLCEIL